MILGRRGHAVEGNSPAAKKLILASLRLFVLMMESMITRFVFSSFIALLLCGCEQTESTQRLHPLTQQRIRDSIESVLDNLQMDGKEIDELPYREAIYRVDTANIKYLIDYATSLAMSEKTADAFRLLRNTLRWSTNKDNLYSCLGDVWQIEAGFKGKQGLKIKAYIDSSLFYFEKAALTDSNNVGHLVNLSIIYNELQRPHDGIRAIEKAMRIQPDNRTHYLFRGSCKITLEDYKGAYEDLSIISDVRRLDPNWYYLRAIAASNINKLHESKLDFDTCELLGYDKPDLYYFRGAVKTNINDKLNGYREIKKAYDMGYPVPEKDMEKINKKLNSQVTI